MIVSSVRSERDTSVHGMNTLSTFRPKGYQEKMFWGWIEDKFGNIVDINCPYCLKLIHHTATGRMICPTCGRSVGDHNKESIDPDTVINRSFINDSKFFRDSKNADRIPRRLDKNGQHKTTPESRAVDTTNSRHEFRATSRC